MSENALAQMIDKLVEEKTFKLEGLQAIGHLKKEAQEVEARLKYCQDSLERALKGNNELSRAKLEVERERDALLKRIADVEAREAKVSQVEQVGAVNAAVANTLRECFQTVFKNTIIRESVQENRGSWVPGSSAGMGPQYVSTPENTVRTRQSE